MQKLSSPHFSKSELIIHNPFVRSILPLSFPSECNTRVRIFGISRPIGHPIYSSPRNAFSKNSLTSTSTSSTEFVDWISS